MNKSIRHAIALAVLLIGAGRTIAADAPANAAPDLLKAFEEICLNTAPTFAETAKAAERYGVEEWEVVNEMKVGLNGDNTFGVQVTDARSCIVTRPRSSIALTKEFIALLEGRGAKKIRRLPAKVDVAGTAFYFEHDRKDGEALVMLKSEK